jgi:hypothetical protein
MTKAEAMVERLKRNFHGPAWHGTALREMVDGVSPSQAAARPIDNARTIAELLGHITAWIEIVERRLRRERVVITPELDFPDVSKVTWASQLERLDAAFERLTGTVMTIENFAEEVIETTYSMNFMLDGLMHHNTYHAAQMAMLKKFTPPEPDSSPRQSS